MIDTEVERLRRLRGSALRVRAVARALSVKKWSLDDALLVRGGCAAWRIARAVTGRLRAHPYAPFQKGPSLGLLLGNSLVTKTTALGAGNRLQGLRAFEQELKALARALDDARALTRAPELSDAFGRSQIELRSLTAAVEFETQRTRARAGTVAAVPPSRIPARVVARPQRSPAPATLANAAVVPVVASPARAEVDWPYLAF